MKKISTKTHGIIDYAASAGLLALPRILRMEPGMTRLLTGSAIFTTLYSLFTKYELGLFKKIPMKTHKMLDAGQSLGLAASPLLFAGGSRRDKMIMLGLSAFEALVTLNTASRPRRRIFGIKF